MSDTSTDLLPLQSYVLNGLFKTSVFSVMKAFIASGKSASDTFLAAATSAITQNRPLSIT